MKRLVAWRSLLPGESINSWVIRLARANALSLHDLGTLCLQRTAHSDMTTDLDMVASVSLVHRIAAVGGVSAFDLQLQSLSAHRHLLCTLEPSKPRITRWVLDQRRTRGQYLEGAWTQACLACLDSDVEPYFRYIWRLAFVTECPVHRTELIDRCPSCGAVIDFTVSERRLPKPQTWHPLSRCVNCGSDMRNFVAHSARSLAETFVGQSGLLQALASRWATLTNGDCVWVGLFMDGCYRLLREFRRPDAGIRLGDLLVADTLPAVHRATTGRAPLEQITSASRRVLMQMLFRLLSDWPENFIRLARQARFTLADVRSQTGIGPYWLDRQAVQHLDRSWYSPSDREVESAKFCLQRRGLAHGKIAVAGLVGKATPSQANGLTQAWPLGAEQRAFRGFLVVDERRLIAVHVRRIATILRSYCLRAAGTHRVKVTMQQLQLEL